MSRVRRYAVLALVIPLVTVLIGAAQAQTPGGRRGFGGSRGSVLGLLSREEVQKELKLTEEQTGKVAAVAEKLRAEMREQYTGLRDIEDMQARRAKMTELSDQYDQKARGELREVLAREQTMRLYQIRMQVRGALDSLDNQWIARRLTLTEEQQKKIAELAKATQDKMTAAYASLGDLSQEERRAKMAEMRANMTKMSDEAEKAALGLLTAEQKEAFEKMKGEKFELPPRQRPSGRRQQAQ